MFFKQKKSKIEFDKKKPPMGNNDSKTDPTPSFDQKPDINPPVLLEDSRVKPRYSIEQNLIYLKTVYNDNYGEIKIMGIKGDSDQNLYALKVFRANDAKTMNAIYQEAEYRREMTLDTVVKIKDVRYDEADLYCSDHFKVLVLLEYFDSTLKDEIQRRKQKNLYFSEIELFSLIDCVLSALILFSKKLISHEDVSPGTIYLTPSHIFKLNDIGFLTEGLNAYKKFLMGAVDSHECYLSPELLMNLKHRSLMPENYDREKSDVFSLGMTTLEAATLMSVNDCYDFDEFKVKPDQIAIYLDESKSRFNPNFCELLICMLEIDETKRPNYQDLYILLGQKLDQIKGNNEVNEEKILQFQDEKPVESIREEKPLRAEPSRENDNFEDLEGRIMKVLNKSEETQKKYAYELENSRHALMQDDLGELVAKREDFLNKTNLIKESLIREREKKGSLEDENFIDSNKLYEVYLEEYKRLKEMK